MKKLSYFFLLAFIFIDLAISTGTKCVQLIGNSLFLLDSLKSDTDYTSKLSANKTIYFNICDFANNKCNNQDSYANLFQRVNGTENCTHLTSNSVTSNFEYSLLDNSNPQNGVQLLLTHGDVNPVDNSTYSTLLKLSCDLKAQNLIVDSVSSQEEQVLKGNVSSRFVIQARTKYACPQFNFSRIFQFLQDNNFVVGVIFLVFGLFECLMGFKALKPTFFLAGFFMCLTILMIFWTEFVLKPDSKDYLIWVLLGVSSIVSILLGKLSMETVQIGASLLGIWLAIVISFILQNLFLYKIKTDPEELPMYITTVLLSLVFVYGIYTYFMHLVIFSTGIIGSYAAVRAIGMFAGQYPNEFTIIEQIKEGQYNQIPWQFYVYLTGMIILAIIGIQVQFKHNQDVVIDEGEAGLRYVQFQDNKSARQIRGRP